MTGERKPDGSFRIHGWVPPFIIALVAAVVSPAISAIVSTMVMGARSDERIKSFDSKLVDAIRTADDKMGSGIDTLRDLIASEASHTREITAFQFAAINHRLESFETRIKTLEGTSAPTYSVQPRKQP